MSNLLRTRASQNSIANCRNFAGSWPLFYLNYFGRRDNATQETETCCAAMGGAVDRKDINVTRQQRSGTSRTKVQTLVSKPKSCKTVPLASVFWCGEEERKKAETAAQRNFNLSFAASFDKHELDFGSGHKNSVNWTRKLNFRQAILYDTVLIQTPVHRSQVFSSSEDFSLIPDRHCDTLSLD